jgi:hypothetical protein
MQQPAERQGHNWHVAEDVRAYVERVDRGDRGAEGLALLTPLVRRPARSRAEEEQSRLGGHYFETLDEQLDFLRDAGFRLVDCFWKRLDLVLIGGYK